SGALHNATAVLTLRPIQPGQLRTYAANIRDRLAVTASALWGIDLEKLEPIFVQYEKWFQAYVSGKPPAEGSVGDVLGNPLLAYLSLRVIAESERGPKELLSE